MVSLEGNISLPQDLEDFVFSHATTYKLYYSTYYIFGSTQSLGREDPLEDSMATPSRILAY